MKPTTRTFNKSDLEHDFCIRRRPSGGFELGETGWSVKSRRAARLAEFYFYGAPDVGLEFHAAYDGEPNALGRAVLLACERVPAATDPGYDALVLATHQGLLSLREAKGIKSLEEMEGLFVGWLTSCNEGLQKRLDAGWLSGASSEAEQLREELARTGLQIAYGLEAVEPDDAMRKESDAFLQYCEAGVSRLLKLETAVEFVYEARVLAREIDRVAEMLEEAFLIRLGRKGPKLGSGVDNWNKICFLYWRVAVLGCDADLECEILFPGYTGLPSEKWKEVPKLLRTLRGDVKRSATKPTLLGREFLPYLVHVKKPGWSDI